MTAIAFGTAIEDHGEYSLPLSQSAAGVVELSGDFDGTTATIGYVDGAGTFAAFRDYAGNAMTATTATAWEVTMPISGKLAVSVSEVAEATPAIVVQFKQLAKC